MNSEKALIFTTKGWYENKLRDSTYDTTVVGLEIEDFITNYNITMSIIESLCDQNNESHVYFVGMPMNNKIVNCLMSLSLAGRKLSIITPSKYNIDNDILDKFIKQYSDKTDVDLSEYLFFKKVPEKDIFKEFKEIAESYILENVLDTFINNTLDPSSLSDVSSDNSRDRVLEWLLPIVDHHRFIAKIDLLEYRVGVFMSTNPLFLKRSITKSHMINNPDLDLIIVVDPELCTLYLYSTKKTVSTERLAMFIDGGKTDCVGCKEQSVVKLNHDLLMSYINAYFNKVNDINEEEFLVSEEDEDNE